MKRLGLAALAAALLLGCGAEAQPPRPYPIEIDGRPVPLDPQAPARTAIGRLVYAGGLELSARGTDSFGGLSGLDVEPDGRFLAVTDAGDLVRGRIRLDSDGRLAGIDEATIQRLADEDGLAFQSKASADAEGLTLLDDGGFAVAFERDHRILVYGPNGLPRRLPVPPDAQLRGNDGIEALAAWRDPRTGAQRLVVGAERGDAWSCDLDGLDCRQILQAERDNPGAAYSLTGLDALPDGTLVAVYRAAGLFRGLTAVIAHVRPDAEQPVTVLARLSGGLTVDNMEAVAAVPGPDGSVRLYLASDDNFARWQRTLLLAFDWTPQD